MALAGILALARVARRLASAIAYGSRVSSVTIAGFDTITVLCTVPIMTGKVKLASNS
jgi:hypothetical protein